MERLKLFAIILDYKTINRLFFSSTSGWMVYKVE